MTSRQAWSAHCDLPHAVRACPCRGASEAGSLRWMAGLREVRVLELLEREEELAVLARCLRAVERAGAGRVVFVAGEAGVGESALGRRFCEGVRGSRVRWGGCDALATLAALGPLVDVARSIGGIV